YRRGGPRRLRKSRASRPRGSATGRRSARRGRLLLIVGELAGQVQDRTPTLGRVDAGVSLEQVAGAGLRQERDLARQRSRALGLVEIADQIGDAAFQRLGDLHQPREADAVGAVLVFLHLLKGDADGARQLILGETQFLAPQAYARAERDVERVGSMFVGILGHFDSLSFNRAIMTSGLGLSNPGVSSRCCNLSFNNA